MERNVEIESIKIPEFDVEELKTGPEDEYKKINDIISEIRESYRKKMQSLIEELCQKEGLSNKINVYYIDENYTHIHISLIGLLDKNNFDNLAKEFNKADSEEIDSSIGIRLLKNGDRFETGVLEYPKINDIYYFCGEDLTKEQDYYKIRTLFTKKLIIEMMSLYGMIPKIIALFNQHRKNFEIIENLDRKIAAIYRYRLLSKGSK